MRSEGSKHTFACPPVTCCSALYYYLKTTKEVFWCLIGICVCFLYRKPTQGGFGSLGVYETVRHFSKHNAHEGHHRPIDHGHHRPTDEQHNVPAVCKSKLRRKRQGQRRPWRSTPLKQTVLEAQWGTGGGLGEKKH